VGGGVGGVVWGAEPRTVEMAPSTAGAMASKTNEGSVQTTSENDRRTGRWRSPFGTQSSCGMPPWVAHAAGAPVSEIAVTTGLSDVEVYRHRQ
jgi:hypothetical protein